MSYNYLLQTLFNRDKTVLGVGPVTKEVVYTCNDISNRYQIPILLIASRRQVESQEINSGYVMTTEKLSKYSKNKYLILCRDHGGCWQGINDNNSSYEDTMKKAKLSYKKDIENNFKIIHIDPSLNLRNDLYERISDLITFCEDVRKKTRTNFDYEIGSDEASSNISKSDEFEEFLVKTINICKKISSRKPLFVVAQTGTYVREAEQVGDFNFPASYLLAKICKKYGVFLKEHNADYISTSKYKEHKLSGISALNIAPELGVLQTVVFLEFLDKISKSSMNDFISYVVQEGKWLKWLKKENSPSSLSESEKCVISGHYHFNDEFVRKIIEKNKIEKDLDILWKEVLRFRIIEILKSLGWGFNI